eukprot:1839599-Heterocapsa_arctica.AAC.1
MPGPLTRLQGGGASPGQPLPGKRCLGTTSANTTARGTSSRGNSKRWSRSRATCGSMLPARSKLPTQPSSTPLLPPPKT